jgi:hypothetical protein
MYFPFAAPIQITPAAANSWEEYTASDLFDLPASLVSGLLLEFRNIGSLTYKCSSRKGGSSDVFISLLDSYSTSQWPTGLDAEYKFSINVSHLTKIEVWALGYFTSGDFFFTDPIDITPSAATTWEEQDLSVYVPAGVGVIVRVPSPGINYTAGCRAADSASATTMRVNHCTFIISKLSESLSIDNYLSRLGDTMQLVGYVTFGSAELTTDMATVTPTANGAYEELPKIGDDDATAGIFNAVPPDQYAYIDVKKNGSSDTAPRRVGMIIAACDEAGLCQGYKSGATCAIYLSGYFLKVVAETQRGACMMGDMWVG